MVRTSIRTSLFLKAAALACPVVALSAFAPAASAQTRAPGTAPDTQIDINVDRPGTANDTTMRPAPTGSSSMQRPMTDTGTSSMQRPMNDGTSDGMSGNSMNDRVNPPNDDRFPSQNVRGDIEGAETSEFNTGNISLEAGVDFATAYIFRGYNQEDSRLIVQPYGQINVNVGDVQGAAVSVYAGVWNSLHSQPTGGDSVAYETDLYGGVNFGFKGFTVGAIYTAYLYPGDAASEVQEVGVSLAYDDAELTSKYGIPFAFNPAVAWFFEIQDRGGDENQYQQLSIEPQVYSLFKDSDTQIDLSVPVTLGTSTDGFFFDEDGSNSFLGFVSVGLNAGLPIPIPASYGEWKLNLGAEYIFLLADSVQDSGDDFGQNSDGELLGRVGVSFAY